MNTLIAFACALVFGFVVRWTLEPFTARERLRRQKLRAEIKAMDLEIEAKVAELRAKYLPVVVCALLFGACAPRAEHAATPAPVCDVQRNQGPPVVTHPDADLCTFVCCNALAIDGCAALMGHCEEGSDGVSYCVDVPSQATCE